MSIIAFKVQLTRRDRDPIFHRFSGTYNFSEISTVISHLWGERPKGLVLDYTDDEGDQVRVTGEAEWVECVRIFQSSTASVLRLTGKRAKDDKPTRSKRGTSAPVADASESDAEAAAPTADPSSVPTLPDIRSSPQPPLNMDPLSTMAAEFLEQALLGVDSMCSAAAAAATGPTSQPASMCHRDPSTTSSSSKKREAAAPKVECDNNGAAVDLMSLMYHCDAGVELFRGATEKFGSVVKRLVNPFMPSEVHLDIDRPKLYRDAVAKGNALIDGSKLQEAEDLLRAALVVFQDSVILEYNLACVLSMQERLEEAVELLLAAKAHGYDDIHQLQTDVDLENVRQHPRFCEVVPAAPVTPVEVSAPVPIVTTPQPEPETECVSDDDCVRVSTPAAVTPVQPEPVPTPVEVTVPTVAPQVQADSQVMTLLSIFPEMTLDEAASAMTRAQGNLSRAVNTRLSGQ